MTVGGGRGLSAAAARKRATRAAEQPAQRILQPPAAETRNCFPTCTRLAGTTGDLSFAGRNERRSLMQRTPWDNGPARYLHSCEDRFADRFLHPPREQRGIIPPRKKRSASSGPVVLNLCLFLAFRLIQGKVGGEERGVAEMRSSNEKVNSFWRTS